ncbi:MAG TPA: carboxylating nicotinate-nucleotide diphosphorylase [candidate division Zixibacteria bacterium]|nr:carboxylating nicotinate-nucleotide diphosphorylase [candidate division Zixibacteria bacterium]
MKKIFPLPKTIIREMLENFMKEDEGYGDITSEILIPEEKRAQARIFTREECILSGAILIPELFAVEDCEVTLKAKDGDKLAKNQDIAIIYGSMRYILKRERVALNLLSRMCGIATKTWSFVSNVPKESKTVVAATRKTTPGLRLLEKYAVTCGGGDTHRLRLDDMVLLKDNHRVLFKSITRAVQELKKHLSFTKKIEVEVEDFETMVEAVEAGADIIMLDNMSSDNVKKALEILKEKGLRDKVIVELSGGINESNIAEYAKLEADVISSGALTHSYKSIDLSLDIIK